MVIRDTCNGCTKYVRLFCEIRVMIVRDTYNSSVRYVQWLYEIYAIPMRISCNMRADQCDIYADFECSIRAMPYEFLAICVPIL